MNAERRTNVTLICLSFMLGVLVGTSTWKQILLGSSLFVVLVAVMRIVDRRA